MLEDVHRDFGDESIEQVNQRQEIERLNAKQESGGLSEVEAASIPSGSIFFFSFRPTSSFFPRLYSFRRGFFTST